MSRKSMMWLIIIALLTILTCQYLINNHQEQILKPMEEENTVQNEQAENLPQTLPKTGRNIFIPIVVVIIAVTSVIAVMKRKKG